MNIHKKPTTIQKMTQMGDVTLFEPAGDSPFAERQAQQRATQAAREQLGLAGCVAHLTTPTGKKPVLKTMMTTACEKNCFYCPFRAGRTKIRRTTLQPDGLAHAFDQIQAAGLVDGLFLSSGIIKGGATSQDKIIDTAEIIRQKYAYRGYIHLKIMPGAEQDQILRAMQVADRVSINLEAPTQERLKALAPKKDFMGEVFNRLQWAGDIRRKAWNENRQRLASLVTQFVVGAVGDTDLELLSLSDGLYNQTGLARTYFAAFHPVSDTPFEHLPSVDSKREFRLYQASFLLRDYAWDVEDLPFLQSGNLRTDVDPKQAWADIHLRHAPIEVMTADRKTLLRLPGIGPKYADAILKARRQGTLREVRHLKQIGIRAPERVAPYVLLDGQRPPHQPRLFAPSS